MRRSRTRSADEPADRTDLTDRSRIRANGWPVLPLRLFLAALFCFAGYAKFAYPRFFEPESPNGFRAAVNAAREGDTPLGGAMGPLADHASLFGHVTAYAEIAIGLGLLVGLLTRLAALGGIVLTLMIALSIAWNGIKEYTGSSGWFTSSELAIAAALTVFLLGGAGPLALDNLFIRARERQRARDDAEPSFRDSDIDDSRRRLQGEPRYGDVSREPVSREPVGAGAGAATAQLPAADRQAADRQAPDRQAPDRQAPDRSSTDRLAADDRAADDRPATRQDGYRSGRQDEEYRDDPEPEPNSLWTQGRRGPEQQAQPERRPPEPGDR